MIKKFYDNKKDLDKLVVELRFDKIIEKNKNCEACVPVFLKSEFDKKTKEVFETIGLKNVFVFHWSCIKPMPKQFDFTTNWNNSLPIHLTYNSCDTIETLKGFYRKDKNSNEFWGLGDSWIIWVERKLIDAKL